LHNITYQHLLTDIKKKLAHASVAKIKECELNGEWIKSVTNHLYWCAANAPDGDDIVKRWKSLINYLCKIHHDPLHSLEERRKKWFTPGIYESLAIHIYALLCTFM